MRRTRRIVDGRLAARLVVIVGALLGLFAMHALSDHGAGSNEMQTAALAPAIAAAHPGHGEQQAHTVASDPAAAPDSAHESATDAGMPTSSMLMAALCLAVIAGAILWLLVRRPHRALLFTRPIAMAFAAARPTGRRDRDPPCLYQLSVLRT